MTQRRWAAVAILLAGCNGHPAPPVDLGTALVDLGGHDAGPPPPHDAGPPSTLVLSFDPTNLGSRYAGHAVARASPLSGCSDYITIDTDAGTFSCGGAPFEVVTQSGGPDLAVFFFSDVVIPSADILVRGSRPLVIVASGSVVIDGRISGAGGYPPADYSFVVVRGNGPGGGGASEDTHNFGGGEGGAYCTVGGLGSEETYHYGAVYGSPTLSPLVGGSSGGVPAYATGVHSGAGGGAIQIVAGVSITVSATGVVEANGAGGNMIINGSGGGSGGSILLEAPTVTVNGTLRANGGNGGDSTGTGIAGTGARDGHAAGMGGTMYGLYSYYAGGGGGAGRIRINTESGTADVAIDAAVSPPGGTPCYSLGMLAAATAPTGPTCVGTPASPTDCDLCLDAPCCDELVACMASTLCDHCRTASTPGPGCSSDATTSAFASCMHTHCPTPCAGSAL